MVTCLLYSPSNSASKYYLHCSVLFIEALKLFRDFQQNISVIMATSPNRGIGRKTEYGWKHGWYESVALKSNLWRCVGAFVRAAQARSVSSEYQSAFHSFISLYLIFSFRCIFNLTLTQRWNAFIREHSIKYLSSRAEPNFTLIHPLTDSLTVSRISLMLLNTLVHVNGFQSQTTANTLFTHFKIFWLPVCGFWLLLSACWF